jgi:hypothetical protein
MAKKGDGTFVLLSGRECAVREVLAGWAGVRAAYIHNYVDVAIRTLQGRRATGAELQTRAGGRGHAGARADAGVWAARRANAFLASRHGGARRSAAVQLSRRTRRRKPGRATQWMSTDTEAEKVR